MLASVGWRDRFQMDECGVGAKDVYEGFKTVDMFAQDAILQAQIEEDGLFYIDGDGYNRMEDRGHRGAAPHTTSLATFRDVKNGSDPYFTDMAWEDGDSGIENRNIFAVRRGEEQNSGASVVVWTAEIDASLNPWEFDAAETRNIEWEVDSVYDYAGARSGPAATTDYTANTAVDGSGTDLTSQLTVSNIVDRAFGKFGVTRVLFGGTAGYLTKLQQRAVAFKFTNWTSQVIEDATSITAYRDRFKKFECLFHDTFGNAEAVGVSRLARRKDPKTRLTLTLVGGDVPTARHMMQRRVSDLVTCVYSDMGINDTFFVEGESWTIDQAGFMTKQILQLREA